MGKKSKKKSGTGSGKKKKGGKKGRGGGQVVVTWREALLAYQINNKDKLLEDLRYELRGLEEQNKRAHERNDRLEQEQAVYMKKLLREARDFEKKMANEKDVDKKDVMQVMKDKWEAGKAEERDLMGLKEQIAHREADIVQVAKEVNKWNHYKNEGQSEEQKHITVLKQEMDDMKTSYSDMSEHMERSIGEARDEIGVQTEQTLDKQKYLATEKAMAKLDKKSRQEVLDNDWLKRELELHKSQAADLLAVVEKIEKSNLKIMGELFECTIDDLKISRNFYLTQFGDNDNLEEAGILEKDLSDMTLPSTSYIDVPEHEDRPQSVLDVIADKVLRLGGPLPETNEHIDSDETDESDYDGEGPEMKEDPFETLHQRDIKEYGDFLQLGPLELKLLNVTGKRMPIYRIAERNAEQQKAESYNPSDWPVTHAMLKDISSPRNT